MSDLAEYFSDKARIKELEKQVADITLKFTNELKLKNKYKSKLELISGEKIKTRGDKAVELIKKLKPCEYDFAYIKEIAKKCFLSETHIKRLWYKS